MSVMVRHAERIVSWGLLPITGTLAALLFVPSVEVVGIGVLISVIALCYDLYSLRSVNFFLLQGIIGMSLCYFICQWTGSLVPSGQIAVMLELLLLICAFLHLTMPEAYHNVMDRIHAAESLPCTYEAKIIVVLSCLHMVALGLLAFYRIELSDMQYRLLFNMAPLLIYLFCMIVNSIGVLSAAKAAREIPAAVLVRVAPVCGKKVLLARQTVSHESSHPHEIWGLPLKQTYEGSAPDYGQDATQMAGIYKEEAIATPRLIMKYRTSASPSSPVQHVFLYILPLKSEKTCNEREERFVDFNDITTGKCCCERYLLHEKEQLRLAAYIWDHFNQDKEERNDSQDESRRCRSHNGHL